MIGSNGRWVLMVAAILSVVNISLPGGVSGHAGGHGNPEDILLGLKRASQETLTGRVLSLPCYLKHGETSLNYLRCSRSPLAKRYISAALLTPEGDLYLLVMDHEDAFKAVAKLISKNVTARGRIVEKNGVDALLLSSIKKTVESKE